MRSLALVLRRLRRRASDFEILAPLHAIVALGVVILFVLINMMGVFALNQAFNTLSGSDKWVSVNYDGQFADVNRTTAAQLSTDQLARLSTHPQTSMVTYRPMPDHVSASFQVLGTTDLQSSITLVDGRLPQSCTPTHCEVVAIVSDAGDPQVAQYGLDIVGHARRLSGSTDLTLLSNTSVLINGFPNEDDTLTQLERFPRVHTWARPLDSARIAHLGIDGFLNTSADAADILGATSPLLRLMVPESQIRDVANHSSYGQRRVMNWILVISFLSIFATALIASAQRVRHGTVLRVLEQNEWSPRAQIRVTTFTLALPSALAFFESTALGILGAKFYVEKYKGFADALNISHVAATIALTWFLGVVLGVVTLHATRRRQILTWIVLIAAVLGCACAINTDIGAIVIPLIAAGIVLAIFSRTRNSRRLNLAATLGANNRPLFASSLSLLAFVFSLVVVMIMTFSALSINIDERGVFKSPLATRIAGQVTQPLALGSVASYKEMTSGGDVYPIVKVPTTAHINTIEGLPVQLLGLPTQVVNSLPDISHQTGSNNSALAQLDTKTPPVGVALPPGSAMTAHVSGLDTAARITVWFLDAQGESQSAPLNVAHGIGTAHIAEFVGPLRFLGIHIYENPDDLARRQHALGEGNNEVVPPRGALHIGEFVVDGSPIEIVPALHSANVKSTMDTDGVVVEYSLDRGPLYVPAVQLPTALPVIADPATVALVRNKKLSLSISTTSSISLDPIGTMTRFPTEPPHFGLMDANTMVALFAALDPAQLNVAELWTTGRLTDPTIATQAPYSKLAFTDQATLIDSARNDEVRLWTFYSQIVAAVSVSVISFLVIRFLSLSVRRRTRFIAWEAIGKTPFSQVTALVTGLMVRIASTIVIAGIISVPLAHLAIQFMKYDFTGKVADPPVIATFPWIWIVITGSCLIVVAKLIALATSWTLMNGKSAYEVTP